MHTLGLNTFFACKILFEDPSCIRAKGGTLNTELELTAIKWCCRAAVRLFLCPTVLIHVCNDRSVKRHNICYILSYLEL